MRLSARAEIATGRGRLDEARADIEEYSGPLWLCYLGVRAEADLAATGRASLERARD